MLPLAYYTLAVVALLLGAIIVRHHPNRARALTIFAMISLIWLAYIIMVSRSGILANFSLPPRLPLLVILPAITSIIIFTGRPGFEPVLQRTPIHLPIILQSFRILVELLIYWAFTKSLLPSQVTFEGTNYDITVGFSALLVGLLAWRGKPSHRLLMAWNIYGLVILSFTAFTFMRTFYNPEHVTPLQRETFIKIPYMLVAAVMLPAAVGLHMVSIRQIRGQQKQVQPHNKRLHAAPVKRLTVDQVI